jgi:hypothetical protein
VRLAECGKLFRNALVLRGWQIVPRAHISPLQKRGRQAGGWRLERQSVAHHRTYRANMGLELNQMFDIDKQKAVLFHVFTIHFVSPKGIMPLNYCHSLLTILTIHSRHCLKLFAIVERKIYYCHERSNKVVYKHLQIFCFIRFFIQISVLGM